MAVPLALMHAYPSVYACRLIMFAYVATCLCTFVLLTVSYVCLFMHAYVCLFNCLRVVMSVKENSTQYGGKGSG
jgi:hypothetical protein